MLEGKLLQEGLDVDVDVVATGSGLGLSPLVRLLRVLLLGLCLLLGILFNILRLLLSLLLFLARLLLRLLWAFLRFCAVSKLVEAGGFQDGSESWHLGGGGL